MLAGRHGCARRNILLFATGLGVPAIISACSGAGSESTDSPQTSSPNPPGAVLTQYEGGYENGEFWFRPMAIGDQGAGSAGDGIGQVGQAVVEGQLPPATYVPPGTGGTGGTGGTAQTNEILIEQMEKHDQTSWPTATCGPTPAKGICVRWRLFSAYPNQDVFRSYFYLTSLTPSTGGNVVVQVPAPGPNVQTSTPDMTLLGIAPATGTGGASASGGAPGLWRYGLLEHSGVESRGQERWLAFVGSGADGTGAWNFHWVGYVRGTLVTPTVRASLLNGTQDKSPYYTSPGAAGGGMATGSDIHATPDGRYVVFSSSANLAPGGGASGQKIYRYDTTTGTTITVSMTSTNANPPAGCTMWNPSISQNGTLVAFQSTGCDLGWGTSRQIYLRNLSGSGTTTLVTHAVGSASTPGNGDQLTARISANGLYITFMSSSGNIITGRPTRTNVFDIYRYNIAMDLVERANVGYQGTSSWPNTAQWHPDISGDGMRVVFDAYAQLLVPGDTTVNQDVFLYDFNTHSLSQMSVSQSGAQQHNSTCVLPAISSDGTTVAMECSTGGSDSFVTTPSATATRMHVYWRTVASASTMTMVDTSPAGTEASSAVGPIPPALNADGQLVGFSSAATNLLRTSGCNTPTGACLAVPTAGYSPFMRDMGTPDPEVKRSYLVSLIRSKANTATLPFAAAPNGLANAYNARALTVIGKREDGASALYLISGGNSTDWAQAPSSGGYQVYVSSFSDALFQ